MTDRSQIPVASLDTSRACYPSADDAVLSLMDGLPPLMKETAFAIYHEQGPDGAAKFCASIGVPGTNDNFSFRTDKGHQLAAIAHTHPADHKDSTFSPNDVQTAQQLNIPSYIRANSTGMVRRFTPGVDSVDDSPLAGSRSRKQGTAAGMPVTRRDQLTAAYDAQQAPPAPGTR